MPASVILTNGAHHAAKSQIGEALALKCPPLERGELRLRSSAHCMARGPHNLTVQSQGAVTGFIVSRRAPVTDFIVELQALLFPATMAPELEKLLHRYRLREVARLIHVGAFQDGAVIRQ